MYGIYGIYKGKKITVNRGIRPITVYSNIYTEIINNRNKPTLNSPILQ